MHCSGLSNLPFGAETLVRPNLVLRNLQPFFLHYKQFIVLFTCVSIKFSKIRKEKEITWQSLSYDRKWMILAWTGKSLKNIKH